MTSFFFLATSFGMQKPPVDSVPEAQLKKTDFGLVPQGPGWYVINASQAQWSKNEKFGEFCGFEGDHRFEQYGVNIHIIHPGQPNCHYHGEEDQENFLVLKGECKLIIEGEEKLLKEWDFVHCPKWTKHVFVGAGSKPCAILMMGARSGKEVHYPLDPIAQKYQACPPKETDSPQESYKDCPKSAPAKVKWPL